jgi:two-component system response regulator FixJ
MMTADKPTVFVLDDDPAIRDSLSTLFKVMKFPAEFFATVSEFLDVYDPSRPGCMLLDIRMPENDGLSLLKKLADSENTLPVIVVTGHGDCETRARATELGAIEFFEKPVDAEQLCQSIREALERESGVT